MAQSTADVLAARRRLRALRRALDGPTRARAEASIRASLDGLGLFRRGAHVALYLPMAGEVDLVPCLPLARQRGVHVYVPRIASRRKGRMLFAPWDGGAACRVNVFGILEPRSAAGTRPVVALDVVVLPLVGFDRHGNRLGMGAGYYDRALRRRLDVRRSWRRPRVVGVAFACQELPGIAASPWDVPLDLVVTERGVIDPRRHPTPRTTA